MATGPVYDVPHSLSQDILSFQNDIWFHGPQVNVLNVMPIGKVWPSLDVVYKAHMFTQLYLQFCYTEFYPNRPANMESMDRNSFKAQIKLRVSVYQFSQTS